MTTYITRKSWTSVPASGATLTGSKLRGVAVHWPGTKQAEIGTSGIEDRLEHYRRYHVEGRGWRDLGYNFAIDQSGNVYMGRATAWHGNLVGAHCASKANPDANHEYVGVLLLLGARERPSAAMVAAFRDWRHRHFLARWPGRTDLRGHGQVPGASTECPGPYALAILDDLAGKPSAPTPSPKPTPRPSPPASDLPVVDLAKLRKAARTDPPRSSSKAAYPTGTKVVERALVAEGLLSSTFRDAVGHFGSKTVAAYGAWQRRLGYRGADADGIPGRDSLTRLGRKYGFDVG